MRICIIIALLSVWFVPPARADITDSNTERRISIPEASASVVIPKEDWLIGREQRRPDNNAVYYMLTSESRQMIFSIYVDKTSACSSGDSCLSEALKNPSYREARELRRTDEGPFKVAFFYLDQPSGAPLKQTHLLAAAYVNGIWIDIHLSKSGKERPDVAPLAEFLKKVTLR